MAEGAIYDFFDEKIHVIDYLPEAQNYIVGFDYGTTNPTAFGIFGYNPVPQKGQPKIWLEREYYWDPKKEKRQKTDFEFAQDFKDFINPVKSKIIAIYGDPSAESFHLQLKRSGVIGLRDAENDVLDGIRTVARMLGTGEFKISKNCVNSIDEFYGYAWDEKAQEKGEDKPLKKSDHCLDFIRYVIFSKFGLKSYDINKFKD